MGPNHQSVKARQAEEDDYKDIGVSVAQCSPGLSPEPDASNFQVDTGNILIVKGSRLACENPPDQLH
ncbi:hypothetical protein J4Q44_G00057410 [Coregonus suidteri]|uniref:Uncharacterized protein n=1 Tax=Coregonus suidteri TaxID=861788 RepID=A0AAN8MAP2_9TELE